MNVPFCRLFWKEYRAQRPLWLVLTGCLLLLQILFLLPETNINGDPAYTPLIGFAVVLTIGFLSASVAILFAGEEDQGTAVWLRQLPVSTRTLFWSKVSVSLLGTLSMLAVGFAVAGIAIGFGGREMVIVMALSEAVTISFLAASIFLLGLFWSLRCQKVFTVLALTCGFVLPLMVLWYQVLDPVNHWLGLIPLAIVALAVKTQPRRWHRSAPQQWTMTTGGAETFSMFWPRWLPTWASLLQRASAAPSQLTRTCGVLLWREARIAVPFAVVALLLGIVASLVRIFAFREFPWPVLLLCFLVPECGLRTCRHDQQHLHGLFWSYRGVSPLLVLITRNIVWLTTLIIVAFTILLIDLPLSTGFKNDGYEFRIVDVVDKIRVPQMLNHWDAIKRPATQADRWLQCSFSAAWLIGGFCISQLLSCWNRKPLLALFLSSVFFGIYSSWMIQWTTNDIPLILSAWLLVASCFVFIVWTRRSWMDRRTSPMITFRRCVLVGLSLLCLWPVYSAWRILQIPEATAARAWHDDPGLTKANQFSTWGGYWELLTTAVSPLHSGIGVVESRVSLDADRLDRAISQIDEMLKSEHSLADLPPKWKTPWSQFPAQPVAFALIQKAGELADGGQPAEALAQLTDATRVLRFLTGEASSWDQWFWCIVYEQQVMQHMHVIAANDLLTAEQLIVTADVMQDFARNPANASKLPANRMAVYSQLLFRYGYLWELVQENKLDVPTRLIDRSFPERIRLLKLLDLTGNPLDAEGDSGPDAMNVARWAATTPYIEETDLEQDTVLAASYSHGYYDDSYRDYLNATRATVTILRLQAYRRQHGRFPATLRELVYGSPPLPPQTFVDESGQIENVDREAFYIEDVETGLPFQYLPDGLGSHYLTNGDSNTRTFISPKQPVLRSHGTGTTGYNYPWRASDLDNRKFEFLQPDSARIAYIDGSLYPVAGPKTDRPASED